MAWVDAFSVKAMIQNSGYDLEYREDREAMCREVDELAVVEVIPVEWLRNEMNMADDRGDIEMKEAIVWLIQSWQEEKEAENE